MSSMEESRSRLGFFDLGGEIANPCRRLASWEGFVSAGSEDPVMLISQTYDEPRSGFSIESCWDLCTPTVPQQEFLRTDLG